MALSPIFKPEGSMIAGLAVVGLVIANYNLHNGTAASAAATDAWDGNLQASTKKAGYSSLALVAGISLLARDPNILILGGAAIIAMQSSYIHSIAVHPQTGQVIAPSPTAASYAPAAPAESAPAYASLN
jgi:hypothetical protein